ncbi:SpoIIE family protein phosphatase [Thermoflexibacter ruber]|uniref:Serine phosphatase RsbU, regulator of sigma subunit n=1 Tax=Thermoflexibacter ruber TaxID=1003 RepID=A0A1I2JBD2_9BACT|nr:SpoIIE family protein phosphatase [Thermoflexibacter ruber]SFF50497.1 Serine phosphatase RsbU, regulator of sigma subunit [Thermoflexibacter ruber]
MNIYVKLTLLCLGLVLFTGASLYFVANEESQQKLKEEISAHIVAQCDYTMNSIDRFLYERLQDINLIASDPIFRDTSATPTQITQRLLEYKRISTLYNSISYFDIRRIRIADTEGKNIGKQHTLINYWKRINQGEEEVIDISFSESLSTNVFHFASVVKDDRGEKIGVVVTRMLVNRFYEILPTLSEKENILSKMQVDLLDAEGVLLYSNYNPNGILREKYNKSLILNYLKNSSKGYHEDGDILYFLALDKGYLTYKGQKWLLIFEAPVDIVYAPSKSLRNRLLNNAIPILIVAMLIGLFIAHRFARPISSLADSIRSLAKGDLDTEITVNSTNEVGFLQKEFKRMAESLSQKIQEQAQLNMRLDTALHKLEQQNKDITSSISYAEKIQRAMLPDEQVLKYYFTDYNILYLPRDIVSGDFYWFDQVHYAGKDYFAIAVADCTGHGVPGGFMSMLGSNLLTSLITFGKNLSPSIVLAKLNKAIKHELHQEKNNIQDGMEIALIILDLEAKKLYFAGGNRPIFIFRDREFIMLEGAKVSIGGVSKFEIERKRMAELEDKVIDIQENDLIYLFSDGYKDQLGGEQLQKFSGKAFRKLLYDIRNLPLIEQKQILLRTFAEWKGEHRQTDDVLVMGIRI